MTDLPSDGPPKLLISVTEIRRHLGSRLDVHCLLEARGVGLTDVRVVDGAELVLDGELESISDGVVLTGSVTVPWVGVCRRCLDDVSGQAEIDVREVYETHPTDGETWPLVSDQIDVGPLLHDTALLAIPLAPLCREDCAGPAPERFPALPADDADHDPADAEPPRDPRWAGLDDLQL